MKTTLIALFTLLCAVTGVCSATVDVTCQVKHGKCVAPVPPAPPAPPPPPVAPPPPPGAEHLAMQPALPQQPMLPAMPAIPAPPPPPKVPEVPAAAHAACAGKAEGTMLVYTIRKGEWMRGECEREDGKMVFALRQYHAD